jgi:cytochrome P450
MHSSLPRMMSNRGDSRQRSFHSIRKWLESQRYAFECYILSHPYMLRVVFAALRRVRPIAVVRSLVVVTKYGDVCEALSRFSDFTLADVLGPKMPWGPILLSLDWREQHDNERQLLQSVVSPADLVRIRQMVSTKCQELVQEKAASGKIDVVSELCNEIMLDVIANYFGIQIITDRTTMVGILGDVANFILVEPPAHSKRWTRAYASMAVLTAHIHKLIALRGEALRAAPPGSPALPDDLLTRLVQKRCACCNPPWFNDDWIRRYITGLAATGGGTIVRAATQAIDQLLAHPVGLQKAQELAATLQTASNPTTLDQFRGIVYEALRFRPMLPMLSRFSPRETIIAKGTDRARTVPGGGTVLAPPIAAMFDPEKFPDPSRFKTDRPIGRYIHFGVMPRECFGRYAADIVVVEIIRALMVLPNLRRAAGPMGEVRYDGSAVTSLHVMFDQAPAGTGATPGVTAP